MFRKVRGVATSLCLIASISLVTPNHAANAQEVHAPGSVAPGAPLPRYIYNMVTADFSVAEGIPLLKTKFNLYDPVSSPAQLDASMDKMAELNVQTYRRSLPWGSTAMKDGKIVLDLATIDHTLDDLHGVDVEWLGSYDRTPVPLQDAALTPTYGEGNLKHRDSTPPKDMATYAYLSADIAKHAEERGTPIGIHEFWNEPDGTYVFFSGTETQYQELYKQTIAAIRKADPEAIVAGPASDHHMLWSKTFIDYVGQNKLPLDLYTFHEYGGGDLAARQVDRASASLNRYPGLVKTGLSLDEWHDGSCCNWCSDDVRNRHEGAPELLHDFAMLLNKPELTSVSWAWWLDPEGARYTRAGGLPGGGGCMGLLTADGHRKAVFNAWKLYAMMPVERNKVTTEGDLESFASSDEHKATLLIWNRDSYDRRMDVHLNKLPFSKGTVKIYRIDESHASFVDKAPELLEVGETYSVSSNDWAWVDGRIPKYGVLYFEVSDDSQASVPAPANVAKVIRIDRYYPERGKTKSYADFDRKTWIARLGMEDSADATQDVAVLAKELPDALDVAVKVDGKLQKVSANSLLAMRIDYMVNGRYSKSVLFHGPVRGVDLYSGGRKMETPFGTERMPDSTQRVADFAKFQLPVKAGAPAGWDGEASITFIMQATGARSRVKITVRKAGGMAVASR